MSQTEIFIQSEADAYYERNVGAYDTYNINHDIVAKAIKWSARTPPRSIADLGCASGERLSALVDRYMCIGSGIDASSKAIQKAKDREQWKVGSVSWHAMDWTRPVFADFDVVITSYVWHWVGREVLMRAMWATDSAVANGGLLVINDFYPDAPLDVPYKHAPGITTYKRRYPDMFLATGLYEKVIHVPHDHHGGEPEACTVLRKL